MRLEFYHNQNALYTPQNDRSYSKNPNLIVLTSVHEVVNRGQLNDQPVKFYFVPVYHKINIFNKEKGCNLSMCQSEQQKLL